MTDQRHGPDDTMNLPRLQSPPLEDDHPDFALRLIVDLSQRVRLLTVNVKSLALDDVYSRVVKLLQNLSVPGGDHRVLPHRLTQQDIADHVGSSREGDAQQAISAPAAMMEPQRDSSVPAARSDNNALPDEQAPTF